jgi:hypothetical protein
MSAKPKMRIKPTADATVSFPSRGPVLNDDGQKIVNDHSTYVDVDGQGVWLHNEKHTFTPDEVHLPYSHAVDHNLVDTDEDEAPTSTDSTPAEAPTTHLEQGHSGNKPADAKVTQKPAENKLNLQSNNKH